MGRIFTKLKFDPRGFFNYFKNFSQSQRISEFTWLGLVLLLSFLEHCQQQQRKLTTFVYLLMQIPCWLHVVFILILVVFVSGSWQRDDFNFVTLHKTKQTWVLGKLQIFHYHYCNKWPRPKVWRGQDHTSRGVNSKNRTRRGGKSTSRARNKYVHSWSICFTSWKWCQQQQCKSPPVFYLLMQISCWLHVVFLLIFMIYLFTSSKWCQQKAAQVTTLFLFTYGNWLLITCGFPFNIHDLFVYLFKAM